MELVQLPVRKIWPKIIWNTCKILEYEINLRRIWKKLIVPVTLDQVVKSNSWTILHIDKIFQETDSAT